MASVVYIVASNRAGAEIHVADGVAKVLLHPTGAAIPLQLGEDFRRQLYEVMSEHLAAHEARVSLIRYRGRLGPLSVADLAAFAVPIVPED